MSLRARLTVLYTSLVGGILILFGVAVYATVTFTLLGQVDDTLDRNAISITSRVFVNRDGELSMGDLPSLSIPSDVFYQLWGRDLTLKATSIPAFGDFFDPNSVRSNVNVKTNVTIGTTQLRVLTVPLVAGERQVGVLQIAQRVTMIEITQRILLTVLVFGTLVAILFAGLAGWISSTQGLAPLNEVTKTALQITRADDLSRRIPYHGPDEDEVGQLITAFNQTLSRLETVFLTQRRFMADVGHELRTPLTVIKGNVGLMRRMGGYDEEASMGIESEVDRLTRMVGDLLLLAQAESGKLPLDMRQVELDTLVLEALQQMSVLARDRLSLRLGDIDQVLVCGDRDRLKQVLVNLIGNAISYTPQGGEVIVSVGKMGNQARLTVKDSGPGIPAEDMPHIFERFYRAEKARTRPKEKKGFGLGLSIAYWIVRNHNGRIDVDSKEGIGTTFCVWLPLSTEACSKSQ